jgi:hypothetical protein
VLLPAEPYGQSPSQRWDLQSHNDTRHLHDGTQIWNTEHQH